MLLNVPDPVPYVCILNDATVNKDKRKMKKGNIRGDTGKTVLLKDDSSVTSYTSRIPMAPR
jgi:hypothetical protein